MVNIIELFIVLLMFQAVIKLNPLSSENVYKIVVNKKVKGIQDFFPFVPIKKTTCVERNFINFIVKQVGKVVYKPML